MTRFARLASPLLALAPLCPSAAAGDLRLTFTGAVTSIHLTPPAPYAGANVGDAVTLVFELVEPAAAMAPAVWLYDADFLAGGSEIGAQRDTWSSHAFQPAATVQDNASLAGDLLLVAGLLSNGVGQISVSILDPSGTLLSAVDLRTMLGAVPIPQGANAAISLVSTMGSPYLDISMDTLRIEDPGAAFGFNYCSTAPNSVGSGATISASGSLIASVNQLLVTGQYLPPQQFAYVISSMDQALVPNAGGSQGYLCLGGFIGRHVSTVSSTGAAGTYAAPIDLFAMPQPAGGAVQVMAGETWNFQLWYRDVQVVRTSNFSDGVAITFQ